MFDNRSLKCTIERKISKIICTEYLTNRKFFGRYFEFALDGRDMCFHEHWNEKITSVLRIHVEIEKSNSDLGRKVQVRP